MELIKKNFLSILIVVFHFILFVFINLKMNIFDFKNIAIANLVLYFFIFLVLTLSLVFFFNKKKIQTLTLILFSTYFSLYLVEFGIIFIQKLDKKTFYQNAKTNNFDLREKFDYFQDKSKEQKVSIFYPSLNHINSVVKKYDYLFPLSGISNIQTIYCNESGYYSEYLSDRYGYNNPDEEWNGSEIDYLLIGDSFTHGACVNRPNDIASNLREKFYHKKNIINLGWGGSGSLMQLAILKEYLNIKKVKNIIWIYFEFNDLDELYLELQNSKLNLYLNENNYSQNLNKRQDEINKFIKENLKIKKDIYIKKKKQQDRNEIFSIIKLFHLRYLVSNIFTKSNTTDESTLNNFEKIMLEAKRISETNNINFTVVYLPNYYRYKRKMDDNYLNYNKIINILKQNEINIIDLKKDFDESGKDIIGLYPSRTFNHFNIQGYRFVSELIFQGISK